jgi:ligand-binding SRPBCC domain-containing protein
MATDLPSKIDRSPQTNRKQMIFKFVTEQFLPTDISTAWKFFSSAGNLAKITPPEMDFQILTKLGDTEIHEGMLINYTVKPLFGIPLKWQTGISKVNKPYLFVDRQLKGPYSIWEHTHIFIEQDGGVLMKDEVRYKLPFGIIGEMTNSLLVKQKVEDIFKYRRKVLEEIFNIE